MPQPQMTIDQFGASVKTKYPQYQDVPDAELGQKVLEKYPVYQDRIIPSAPQQPGWFQSTVQSVAKPFEKTAASALGFVQGTGSLLGAGLTKLAGGDPQAQLQQAQEAMTKERDFGYFGKARPIGIEQDTGKREGFVQGTKDILGTGAELGSYFAPTQIFGAGAKAYKGTKPLVETLKASSKAGALGLGLQGAGEEAQRPESTIRSIVGEGTKGAVLGAVTAPIVPLAGAGIRGAGSLAYKGFEKAAPTAAKMASEVAGKYTGAGAASFEEVLKSPNVMKYAREFGDRPEILMRDALASARSNLEKMSEKSYKEYAEALSKIRENPTKMTNILTDIQSRAADRLSGEDFGAVISRSSDGKFVLDMSKSPIIEGRNLVEATFNDIANWSDATPKGLDILKKRVDVYRKQAQGPARQYIADLRHTIADELKNKVHGYKEMVGKSEMAINLQEEIEKALSIGTKKDIDQASRRLMSVLRQNNEVRRDFLQALQEQGGENVVERLAAAQLSPTMPRGITGAMGSLAGVTSFVAGGFPGIIIHLLASSPRLMGEFFDLLRKIKQFGGKEVPSVYQMQLRSLLKKAQEQFEKDLRGEGQPKLLTAGKPAPLELPIPAQPRTLSQQEILAQNPELARQTELVKNPPLSKQALIRKKIDRARPMWELRQENLPKGNTAQARFIARKQALLQKDLTENELRQEIDKYVEEFRKRSGLLAQREGAGVTTRQVKDAVGDVQFVSKDFSLNRAKASMYNQAQSAKKAAYDELLATDPIFQELVKRLEQKNIPF